MTKKRMLWRTRRRNVRAIREKIADLEKRPRDHWACYIAALKWVLLENDDL